MKKLLVIGAGFLQSFVIQRAKQLGYITLAVDGNPNAVGFQYADKYAVINIVDSDACLVYAKKENIDGVLTAATDYGVLTASYIAREMNLPGLDYEAAKLVKNKYLVRKRLFEERVDDTEQAFKIDAEADLKAVRDQLRFPVMVKPCDGSGSRGTSRVDSADTFEDACRFAMDWSISHRATVETFVFGKEYGAESIVVDGEPHVLAIMRKWMTKPPYYAELGHAIPTDLPKEIEERAKDCVYRAIKALGINFGSVNMDMLITPEGTIHIIDVGARMGGNMIGPCVIPYGTGIDYVANVIRNSLGDQVDLTPMKHSAVATRLLAFDGGAIRQLPDMNAIEREYGVEIYHHMQVGDVVNEYHTNLDGCGYIVARASQIDKAVSQAEAVLQIIKNVTFS